MFGTDDGASATALGVLSREPLSPVAAVTIMPFRRAAAARLLPAQQGLLGEVGLGHAPADREGTQLEHATIAGLDARIGDGSFDRLGEGVVGVVGTEDDAVAVRVEQHVRLQVERVLDRGTIGIAAGAAVDRSAVHRDTNDGGSGDALLLGHEGGVCHQARTVVTAQADEARDDVFDTLSMAAKSKPCSLA